MVKHLTLGTIVGGLIGSAIALIVLAVYPGVADLQASSSLLIRILLGVLFGGVLVGTVVGWIIGNVWTSVMTHRFFLSLAPGTVLRSVVMAGIMGGLVWAILGSAVSDTSSSLVNFLALSGLFSGAIGGGNAAAKLGMVAQGHANQRAEFASRWGKPAPTYEEHLRATGQREELKEHRQAQRDLAKQSKATAEEIRRQRSER